MPQLKKQLKFSDLEPEIIQEVVQTIKVEQVRKEEVEIKQVINQVEYEDVVVALENCLRDLDNRLEMAHKILPELEKQDIIQYTEAHQLYRELLWKWQRARLALLMLKLEHPNYNIEAFFEIEKEHKGD